MLRRGLKYNWRRFAGDCFGGAIAALIALPYGLAMATLMGLPPALGLFTSLLTAPITAFLGKNPVLIGGTSTVTVPFLAIAVSQQGVGGAAKVTLVAAVFMMAFSVLRLGRYISKVPPAIVSGFSCGIGGMMIVSQLKPMFGLKVAVSGTNATITQLLTVLQNLAQTRWEPLVLSIVVIAAAFAAAKFAPKAPAPLIGVVLAFAVGQLLGVHEKEVGRLPLEIPPFVGFTWSAADVWTVLPSGLGLAFVASMNLLLTSRVVEHFSGRRHGKAADNDAELGAYGIANVCAGVFGAPMSVGIPARSLANVRCGGTSRVSNIVHALFLLLFLSLGADAVSHIPVAALAGVTAYVGICLLEWGTWRRLAKMRPLDSAAFLVVSIATLITNITTAFLLGCSLYLFHKGYVWIRQQNKPVEIMHAQLGN